MTATLAKDAAINDLALFKSLDNIPSHLITIYPMFKDFAQAMSLRLK